MKEVARDAQRRGHRSTALSKSTALRGQRSRPHALLTTVGAKYRGRVLKCSYTDEEIKDGRGEVVGLGGVPGIAPCVIRF